MKTCKTARAGMAAVAAMLICGQGCGDGNADQSPGVTWHALGSGLNIMATSLAADSAGNVYAGGYFTTAGGVPARYVAKWNGSSWSALAPEVMETWVNAVAVDGSGNLYAAGNHQGPTPLAKWNGTAWSIPGTEIETPLDQVVVDRAGNVYVSGIFHTIGAVRAEGIAKWNGSSWSALGRGLNGTIWALVPDGAGNLYAGGGFQEAGGVPANRVARWDGARWSALGEGMNGVVRALAVDSAGNLYAGGQFTAAGGQPASNIAKWDGINWHALGAGVGYRYPTCEFVDALAVDAAGNVYAGGEFGCAGNVTANYVAKWNGSEWSAVEGFGEYTILPTSLSITALAVDSRGNLYVAGSFGGVGGMAAANIAMVGP